ncbi:metal dependent phosphohydrolase [Dethiosulfovibrio peptidovorans DSM 11002]|uniref:Metal dependent phosphohydrolase n=1 Tax=Dethiosulfovibrio peptidovorans DSM 11002 TaxID=469381 RepID=D2Z758_9BACT|nr:HD domain-containing phosphohydrolase [Dethiosulfovibrio peptidovorans]EFC91305.1 metal dependent phosphohydrolase [Dethiosulfovibrio peptidovorans DSM 11002]
MAIYIASIDVLEPGMVVGRPIFGAGGIPLVTQGIPLSRALINAIRRQKIEQIYIKDDSDGPSETPQGLLSHELEREGRRKVEAIFSKAVEKMSISVKDIEVLSDLLSSVMAELSRGGSLTMGSLKAVADMDKVTFDHCWSVAVLSLALYREAIEDGWLPLGTFQDGINMGLGAVLHDIGKLKVPLEILNKPGMLNEKEWEEMRLHPWHGLELVRNQPNVMPMARGIIIHHHQRLDGKGYGPRSSENILSGDKIPKIVRLASVADVYDAIATDRPYRPGYLPWEVLRTMRKSLGDALDAKAFSLLERMVVPFPIGCFVLLKRGEVCMVTRSDGPWGRVLALMTPLKGRALGDIFSFGAEDVLLGGTTLQGLAWRVRREFFSVLGKDDKRLDPSGWSVLSDWKDRLLKAFGR